MNDRTNRDRSCQGCQSPQVCDSSDNGVCCIDTYRIFDSCRSQDCIENARIWFTDCDQEAVNNAVSLRTKSVRTLRTAVSMAEAPFNAGYFRVSIRYYFMVILDCCISPSNTREIQGLAVYDKSVILYGGEGAVSTFVSEAGSLNEGAFPGTLSRAKSEPRVVVEVAEPMALKLDLTDENFASGLPSQSLNETVPEEIAALFNGCFDPCAPVSRCAFITIGAFSIIRIERASQLVIPACDVCIPPNCDRKITDADPCAMFRALDFPLREFYPSAAAADIPAPTPEDGPLDPEDYK